LVAISIDDRAGVRSLRNVANVLMALLIQRADLFAAAGGVENRGDDLEALDAVAREASSSKESGIFFQGRRAPANLFNQLRRPSRRAARSPRCSGFGLVGERAAVLVACEMP
jgi:hypothetical protein